MKRHSREDRISLLLKCAVVSTFVTLSCGCFGNEPTRLQQAEELTRQERLDEAIAVYQEHIEARLAVKDRPEWENPYFYQLIIGDLYLRDGKVDDALVAFKQAEVEGVEPGLVSDRYRSVASWYEKSGNLERAIEILKIYRGRDELLFDSMLDRIARKKVQLEDQSNTTIPQSNAVVDGSKK